MNTKHRDVFGNWFVLENVKNLKSHNRGDTLQTILGTYGLTDSSIEIKPFGTGLINNTWILKCIGEDYIFQKINTTVFNSPEKIAENLHFLKLFFTQNFQDYLFVSPVTTSQNEESKRVNFPNCLAPSNAMDGLSTVS